MSRAVSYAVGSEVGLEPTGRKVTCAVSHATQLAPKTTPPPAPSPKAPPKAPSRTTSARAAHNWRYCHQELMALLRPGGGVLLDEHSLGFAHTQAKEAFNESLGALMRALALEEVEADATHQACWQAWRSLEQHLCAQTGIEGIELPLSLQHYLNDAPGCAAKVLHDLALSLLRAQCTPKNFEGQARVLVRNYYAQLDRYLYEAWVCYGIIANLEPVVFWNVGADEQGGHQPIPAKKLVSGYQDRHKNLRLPEALFTTKSGQAFAYKHEAESELEAYKVQSRKKDLSAAGNTVDTVCHRVMLLYRINSVDAVPVLATRSAEAALAPWVMAEYLMWADLETEAVQAALCRRAALFASPNPVQVVCDAPLNNKQATNSKQAVQVPACARVTVCEYKVEQLAPLALVALQQNEKR